jgi:serine phosphatase RsbU (regulator of sigma subunit)
LFKHRTCLRAFKNIQDVFSSFSGLAEHLVKDTQFPDNWIKVVHTGCIKSLIKINTVFRFSCKITANRYAMGKVETPIRVAIVDDQALIRSGLGAFLLAYNELQLVGEANDGEEAIQLCELVQPDVVLMDLKMPKMDGIAATTAIKARWPQIQVLVLTSFKNNELVDKALEAGAKGYLLKNITAQELADAIINTHRGQMALDKESILASDPAGLLETSGMGLADRSSKSGQSEEQQSTQELVTAGKMQSDILPERPPVVKGWEVCALLEPARETSGDFYDFIPLDNGKLGIVIADVSDKGMGAALFMALASTLIRTYAPQYPTLPSFALNAVNRRILTDTRGNMFVTVFYGVLEPDTGRLRYVNAGHNPPYMVSVQKGKPVDKLRRTGMALGVLEDAVWQQKMVKFVPGDTLLLYTDGVTEAQNREGNFFGEQRLLEITRSKTGCKAQELQNAVMHELRRYIGDTPNQDDITLVVISRDRT